MLCHKSSDGLFLFSISPKFHKKKKLASLKGFSEMSKPNNFLHIHFQIEDKHKYKPSGEFHSLKPSNTQNIQGFIFRRQSYSNIH